MHRLFLRWFDLIPDGWFKNKLACFIYNVFMKLDFKIYYRKKLFEVKFNRLDRIFYFVTNPYNEFTDSMNGYLTHFVPQEGDIVVDAGAGIGGFTIYLSVLIGKNGIIYALEPDPMNYEIIKRNLDLNHVSNVKLLKYALWNKKGKLFFNATGEATSNIQRNKNKADLKNVIEINSITLDEFAFEEKMKEISFLKMDIEGAEIEALQGAKNLIQRKKIQEIAVASYHIVNYEETSVFVEQFFFDAGYNVFTCNPKHKTTIAYKKHEN